MAQRIETILIDDLDGGAASQTVKFGLDGKQYEIDLSDKHVEQLHKALSRFIENARRVRVKRAA